MAREYNQLTRLKKVNDCRLIKEKLKMRMASLNKKERRKKNPGTSRLENNRNKTSATPESGCGSVG